MDNKWFDKEYEDWTDEDEEEYNAWLNRPQPRKFRPIRRLIARIKLTDAYREWQFRRVRRMFR